MLDMTVEPFHDATLCLSSMLSAGKEKIISLLLEKASNIFFFFAEKRCEKDRKARNFAACSSKISWRFSVKKIIVA